MSIPAIKEQCGANLESFNQSITALKDDLITLQQLNDQASKAVQPKPE